MIEPLHCVELLLLNAPAENAIAVVDFMIWMADQCPALKDSSEFLAAWNLAYSKLDHHDEARDAHAKGRLEQSDREDRPPSVQAIGAPGNH